MRTKKLSLLKIEEREEFPLYSFLWFIEIMRRRDQKWRGFGFRSYKERDLSFCFEALCEAGYENLAPLLERKLERAFLAKVKESLTKIIREGISGQVVDERMKAQMRGFSFGISFRVIPPEELWGICGRREKGSGLSLTDIGRGIVALSNTFPSLSLFLIGGIAREVTGSKPRSKRRDHLPLYSFQTLYLRRQIAGERWPPFPKKEIPLPSADIDLLAVAGENPPTLEEIREVLAKEAFLRQASGKVEVLPSRRRPGFVRVDFGVHWWLKLIVEEEREEHFYLKKELLLGQIFYPPLKGKYHSQYPLLPFLMSKTRADTPVLLVPIKQAEGTLVWGVEMDFFRGWQFRKRPFFWKNQPFFPAHYPFPQIVFPKEDPAESLFNLGHRIRSWPWQNEIPIIRSPGESYLTDDQIDKGAIKVSLAQETQEYLTYQVIYPLTKLARENPSVLGTESQRKEMAISLLEDIAAGLDGDPLATTVRCLRAGVRDEELSPPWVIGLGIFDEDGFFPELGQFLEEETPLGKRREVLIRRMKECPHGGVERRGWQEFLNFLFEQTGGDAKKVAFLLTPIFYPDNWQGFVRDHLLKVDARFIHALERIPCQELILLVLERTERPLTAREIAEILQPNIKGISVEKISEVLRGQLEPQGLVA